MKISRRKLLQTAGGTAAVALLGDSLVNADKSISRSAETLSIVGNEIKDGNVIPLSEEWLQHTYLMDLDYNPIQNVLDIAGPGKLSTALPNKAFAVAAKLNVPGFGICYVYADNGGKGYDPEKVRDIDLNRALVQSRLDKVHLAKKKAESSGIVFSRALDTLLESATTRFKSATSTVGSEPECEPLMQCLADSLLAGEMLAVERAKQRIAKSEPREDFLFGCNAFRALDAGEDYTKAFYKLFNYCTHGVYWSGFERERGNPYYGLLDLYINWAAPGKLKSKGHPLVWANTSVLPEWLTEDDIKFENYSKLCASRVKDMVSRYKGRVDIWDVINEAHDWLVAHGYTYEQMLELTDIACTEAGKANPATTRIVNNTLMWGEYTAPKPGQPVDSPTKHTPHQYVRDLLSRGVDLDVVGIQLYYPERDMFEIDLMLERFAQFGLPIHITELGVPSATTIDEESLVKHPYGLWHEPWSEKVQADWMEQFYTIAYSKPYIKAISWWDFVDIGHFWPHGGWLTPDLKQKKICGRFDEMLNQWRVRKQDG